MKKRVISLAVCFVFCFSLLAALTSASGASVDSLYSDIAILEQKEKNIKSQKSAAENEKYTLKQKKAILDNQMTNTQSQITALTTLIADLDEQYEEAEKTIKESQENLDQTYESYKKNIRADYENGEISYLTVILGSKSVSDFLSRLEFVREIMEYNITLMNRMKDNIKKIEESETVIKENKKKNEEALSKLASKKKELASQEKENDKLIQQINSKITDYTKIQKEYENQIAALNRQIASLTDSGRVYAGGTLAWPCPGYTYITSHFGPRNISASPSNFHYGMDISGYAIHGKDVVAVNSGKVILITYTYGEGNIVSVDHGGGMTSQYKHLSAVHCSVGQEVKKGQRIASVGNTGAYTTGAHLHFEISINGTRVDPEKYAYSGKV